MVHGSGAELGHSVAGGVGIPVDVDSAGGWRLSWLRGRDPGGAWIWHGPRGKNPVGRGSGAGLWPGTAQGADSPAEWSSSSAELWGEDLAGWLFFF
jgi:hypothetical protein